ncbi:MAG: hypothetical protein WC136_01800 [Sphaerochaeta sp.]|jgi:hypothetical protein
MNFFKKQYEKLFKKSENCDYIRPEELQTDDVNLGIPEIVVIDPPINDNKKNILVMDDQPIMVSLIVDELLQISNVGENFNILTATGDYAAFSVKNFINNNDTVLNLAFLDITIGGVISGVEYDGVDIAIMIKNKFPQCEIKFITGHTLNRKNPEIFKFIEKFENYFQIKIDETFEFGDQIVFKHIIPKTSDRTLAMQLAIEGQDANN